MSEDTKNNETLDELVNMDPRMVQRVIDADPVMKAATDDLMKRSWDAANKFMNDNKDHPDILLYSITNLLHMLMGGVTGSMNPEEIAAKFPQISEQYKTVVEQYEGLSLAEAIYLLFAQAGFVSSYALMADVAAAKQMVTGADSNAEA